jgi:multiple sugar transport system substrate-binding protein
MNNIILKGITWDHPRGYEPLIAASLEYLKLKGIRIEWNKRSLGDFGDFPVEDLARKYDLLIIDHPHCGIIARTNCLEPLENYFSAQAIDEFEAQSAGPSFDSYNHQGHQWALPVDAAVQCSAYRPDLLDDPLPQNWDDVFQLSGHLREEGKYIGMALCGTDALCTFLSMTHQFGAGIREGSPHLVDLETGEKVLGMMKNMIEFFHPQSIKWNPIRLFDYMAESDDVAYAPIVFGYNNYCRAGFRRNLLAFGDPPEKSALLGGAGIAVSSYCQHKTAAAEYCAWLCGAEIQKTVYARNQGQPAQKIAWEDAELNRMTHGFFTNTFLTLKEAYVRPRSPGWPRFQQYLGETIHDFLINGRDIHQTLRKLEKAFQDSGI